MLYSQGQRLPTLVDPRPTFQVVKLPISISPILTSQTPHCVNQPHTIFSCSHTTNTQKITNLPSRSHTRTHHSA